MKRTIAIAVFLVAIGVLAKLTLRSDRSALSRSSMTTTNDTSSTGTSPGRVEHDPKFELLRKYQDKPLAVRELIARTTERFGHNALAIENSDGVRGLVLLDRMDLEALFLYEKHPADFRRLR